MESCTKNMSIRSGIVCSENSVSNLIGVVHSRLRGRGMKQKRME